jgi:TonB family protein
MQRSFVLFLSLLWHVSTVAIAAEPSPAPSSPVWKFDNPFCEVLAGLVPFEGIAPGSEYGVQLYASHGTTVAAHVTLIGAENAYDANVTVTNLQGAPADRRSEAIVVKLAKPEPIHYFFVDSFSIDGGTPVTCPSYVFRSGSGPSDDSIGGLGLQTVTAAFLEKLPDLPCGKAFIQPSIAKGFDPLVGFYGNQRRTTELHVYVDSNGTPIRSSIMTSSGVEGLDDAAYAGVQYTRYHPAKFLCTPVVGEITMTMDYAP